MSKISNVEPADAEILHDELNGFGKTEIEKSDGLSRLFSPLKHN